MEDELVKKQQLLTENTQIQNLKKKAAIFADSDESSGDEDGEDDAPLALPTGDMKILPKKPEVVKKDSDSDEDFKPPSKSNLSKLKKLFDDDDDENEVD